MQQVTNLKELKTAINLNGEMVVTKNNKRKSRKKFTKS